MKSNPTKILLLNFNLTMNHLGKLSLFLFVISLSGFDLRAQDSLRDFLNPRAERPVRKTASTKKTIEPRTKTAPKKPAAQPPQKTPKKVLIKPSRSIATVTFVTGEPYAEVWINDKKSGQTNEKAVLEKKLAMGEYRVMARNKLRVLYPRTKISVSADRTTFNLFEERVEPPAVRSEDSGETKQKSNEQLALEISVEVKRILQDYADPKKTDSISPSDWELVYKASQLGQLQGYTAVDVEAHRWFASGQLELANNNYTNAFTAFNKAMEFMPNSGLLFYAIGNTYLANKRPADALKAYQRSLQLSPKSGMAYKRLGDTFRLLGKEKEAISAYKNAVQNDYENVETRFGLALTMLQMKQYEDAITQLLEVEKEKPTAEVYTALGDAYEKLKRDVSAIEYYQKAIQASPGSAAAYFKLGDVYYSQREYVKAKEVFEKAVALDPEGKIVNKSEAQKKLREAASKIK